MLTNTLALGRVCLLCSLFNFNPAKRLAWIHSAEYSLLCVTSACRTAQLHELRSVVDFVPHRFDLTAAPDQVTPSGR